jgi:hypothetical protein
MLHKIITESFNDYLFQNSPDPHAYLQLLRYSTACSFSLFTIGLGPTGLPIRLKAMGVSLTLLPEDWDLSYL